MLISTQCPPTLNRRANALVGLYAAGLAQAAAGNDDEAEATADRVRADGRAIDKEMLNAGRRIQGALPTAGSPLRRGAAAGGVGLTDHRPEILLLVDAVRQLAEVVATAVCIVLDCETHAYILQGNVDMPLWPDEDQGDFEEDEDVEMEDEEEDEDEDDDDAA